MADFGFGAEIGRDEDANRWALATPDVVAGPDDWVATPVTGQRAVTISAGQGQAAQITMPGGVGAKTDPVTLQVPFDGSMTHQGKLICRELTWTGNGSESDPLAGSSQFVVLDAGDFPSAPAGVPSLDGVMTREPGTLYHVPLWFAVVTQTETGVTLFDLRNISPVSRDGGPGTWKSYSPNLVGFGTGVSLLRARYAVVGNTVTGRVALRTSVNGLAGTAFVGLPVAAAPTVMAEGDVLGSAYMADASAGSGGSRTGAARLAVNPAGGSALTHASVASAAGGNVSPGIPFTWATGDVLSIEFQYERGAA